MTFLPSYVKRVGPTDGGPSTLSAIRLFDGRAGRNPPFVALPWSCIPEVPLRSTVGYPAFNVDMKTLEAVAWDEIVTRVCMGMLDCMFAFRAVLSGEPEPDVLIYHEQPPCGYGLLSSGGSAFFVAVEWVGRLFVTPISHAFTLGAPEHKAAMEKLTTRRAQQWLELDMSQDCELLTYPEETSSRAPEITWSRSPVELRVATLTDSHQGTCKDQFIKIITLKAFSHLGRVQSGLRFRHLYRVYNAYQKVFVNGPSSGPNALPSALVPAQLRYGEFSLMVQMPFLVGREAETAELHLDGPVVEHLAALIVWLARHGLLYCDIRPSNVIVAETGGALQTSLVDYDDMMILPPDVTIKNSDQVLQLVHEDAARRDDKDCSEILRGLDVLRGRMDNILSLPPSLQ